MFTDGSETLCNRHDTIKYLTRDIKKKLKKAIKEKVDIQDTSSLFDTLDEILKVTKDAKRVGNRMEARLILYKRNIEALGFQRINKRGKAVK